MIFTVNCDKILHLEWINPNTFMCITKNPNEILFYKKSYYSYEMIRKNTIFDIIPFQSKVYKNKLFIVSDTMTYLFIINDDYSVSLKKTLEIIISKKNIEPVFDVYDNLFVIFDKFYKVAFIDISRETFDIKAIFDIKKPLFSTSIDKNNVYLVSEKEILIYDKEKFKNTNNIYANENILYKKTCIYNDESILFSNSILSKGEFILSKINDSKATPIVKIICSSNNITWKYTNTIHEFKGKNIHIFYYDIVKKIGCVLKTEYDCKVSDVISIPSYDHKKLKIIRANENILEIIEKYTFTRIFIFLYFILGIFLLYLTFKIFF